MKKAIALVVTVLLFTTSCKSWFENDVVKPVENDVVSAAQCIKAKEAANTAGIPTGTVVTDILKQLGTAALGAYLTGGLAAIPAALIAVIDPLVVKYGQPIVACISQEFGATQLAVLSTKVPPTSSGSAVSAAPPHNPMDDVFAHYGWKSAP